MAENQENRINIELSEEIAQGIYSNLAVISHSEAEFVIDFIRVVPGVKNAKVKSRIILTPQHAKRLLIALQENISKYEANFGKIQINQPKNPPIMPMNFGPTTAEA